MLEPQDFAVNGAHLEPALNEEELEEGEVLRRFGRLRARMVEASASLSENKVAAEVAAARAELEG